MRIASFRERMAGMAQPTFGAGVHPDLPLNLVHFVGRPRTNVLPYGVSVEPEQRLAQILHAGYIRAFHTYRTEGPVLCLSESSWAALHVMFGRGVTSRGPYAPWALLLRRDAAVAAGVRPVWYMADEELQATASMPMWLRDRRVRYVPGVADWLAEREWRLCWGDAPICPGHVPGLALTGLLTGVIVGQQGWYPPASVTYENGIGRLSYAIGCHGIPRWWWNGQMLRDDGVFDLNYQVRVDDVRSC